MPNPLVTVVIPSYNRAQYIAETIESVLGQTYTNIEIIVIDDGSTDNTREIVERYAPRVQYVWQENAERGASRNHGLRLAKGAFIAFLDSDDLWLREKVENDLELLRQNPAAGVVFTDAVQIDAVGNETKKLSAEGFSGTVTERLLENNFVLMGAHLARTDLIRKIGGFREERELAGSEDWELWVRLSTETEFGYRPAPSAKIRAFHENTMGDPNTMNRSMSCAVRIMEESYYLTPNQKKLLNRTKAMVALVNGINFCTHGETRKAAAYLKNAAALYPATVLDLRFGYTILRIITGNRISKLRRSIVS